MWRCLAAEEQIASHLQISKTHGLVVHLDPILKPLSFSSCLFITVVSRFSPATPHVHLQPKRVHVLGNLKKGVIGQFLTILITIIPGTFNITLGTNKGHIVKRLIAQLKTFNLKDYNAVHCQLFHIGQIKMSNSYIKNILQPIHYDDPQFPPPPHPSVPWQL